MHLSMHWKGKWWGRRGKEERERNGGRGRWGKIGDREGIGRERWGKRGDGERKEEMRGEEEGRVMKGEGKRMRREK